MVGCDYDVGGEGCFEAGFISLVSLLAEDNLMFDCRKLLEVLNTHV